MRRARLSGMEHPPGQSPLCCQGNGHLEEVLEGIERLGAPSGDQLVPVPFASGAQSTTDLGDRVGSILRPHEIEASGFDRALEGGSVR